jgi:putative hydrolase of the HAD superfamily
MIFFDIDDTLFNNTDAEIKAAQRFYAQSRGLEHFAGIDDFVQQWRTSTETYLQMFIDGRIPFQEQRRRRLRDIFRESFSDKAADALFEQYLQLYEDSWALFPDVVPCLDRLASLPLGIITNGNSEQQRQKLRELGIIDCFDIIVVSEEVGTSKPDPQIFKHACKTAQKMPSSCFYVGDKLETDALAASAAGLNGIWLNRNHPKSQPNRIREIDTLYALQGDNFS